MPCTRRFFPWRRCGSARCRSRVARRRTVPPLDAFQNLPANCDPKIVGEKVCANFLPRKIYRNNDGYIVYPEVCAAFGALRFADAAGDAALKEKLIARYEFILTPEGSRLVSTNRHVDFHVFGVLPLEIYLLNGDERYRDFGLRLADDQWRNPRPDGLAQETRWWVDDCFMIGSLQIQAFRATQRRRNMPTAWRRNWRRISTSCSRPNGLFYHADISPHFWGRGNGWFAAALAEVLRTLPPDHPKYARLMAGYKTMMAALKKYQAPSGLWRQLLDNEQAWDETSCTGMFTYALIVGVKHGWLDASYAEVARRGWIGLCGKIDATGAVQDVCVGTNQKDDTQYYLDRPRATGDLHGQAPILWCAWALLEK